MQAAMKLPHYESVVVPIEKVVNYLLSPTHPWGRHKAAFFSQMGFTNRNWKELIAALKRHVADHDVAKIEPSDFGTRFVVEGIIEGRNGKIVIMRTVWFVAKVEEIPRFITAYPTRG